MDEAIFRVGDRVRCDGTGAHGASRIWTVMGEDTNRTPTVDPEPAYRLQAGKAVRYAYQSVLVPAILVRNEEAERG